VSLARPSLETAAASRHGKSGTVKRQLACQSGEIQILKLGLNGWFSPPCFILQRHISVDAFQRRFSMLRRLSGWLFGTRGGPSDAL